MVRFTLPASWRTLAGSNFAGLTCDAVTVGQALTWLTDTFPVFKERIITEDGDLAPWTLVCLNHIDVRSIGGLAAEITGDDSELEIIPALMGG
ncbi:hypothetical protein [Nocardia pneumoniae]|uniref:hypothetical protein n=1 Tax=Nocardia pneumoniae TaxID=228601 RepID=UPI000592C528|nr:hypothetical protein [Nocardia pneumoniae]